MIAGEFAVFLVPFFLQGFVFKDAVEQGRSWCDALGAAGALVEKLCEDAGFAHCPQSLHVPP